MAYREITVVCFGTKYTVRENIQCLMTLEQVVSIVTAADVIKRDTDLCGDPIPNTCVTQMGHGSIYTAIERSLEGLVQATI
jgi:hypothetical protein